MSKQTCLFIGGFARSGKTSVIKRIKANGHVVGSTSETLYHYLVGLSLLGFQWQEDYSTAQLEQGRLRGQRYCQLNPESLQRFQSKHPVTEAQIVEKTGMTIRQAMIWLAEEQIVLKMGREIGLVLPALNRLKTSKADLVFFETIGGYEFELANQNLADYTIKCVNMRSLSEEGWVDSRKRLPNATDIWFDPDRWYFTNAEDYQKCVIKQILEVAK